MSKTIHKLKCSACGHFTNAQDVYNKALSDVLEALEGASELARPVGWTVKSEIVTLNRARWEIERLRIGDHEND